MRRAEMRSKETDGGSCKNEPVLHPPVSKVTPGKPSPPPPRPLLAPRGLRMQANGSRLFRLDTDNPQAPPR